MFQNIRKNSQVYILHKTGKPTLEIGIVQDVSNPMPRYPMSPQSLYAPPEMAVDITVAVGDRTVPYQKIPINADVAEIVGEGSVIATSREAMNAEAMSLKQRSVEAINSVGYHQDVVAACDGILNTLNPEFAERRKQQDEIGELKQQIAELKGLLMSGTSKTK